MKILNIKTILISFRLIFVRKSTPIFQKMSVALEEFPPLDFKPSKSWADAVEEEEAKEDKNAEKSMEKQLEDLSEEDHEMKKALQELSKSRPTLTDEEKKQRPCYQFERKGYCKKGDRCPFKHEKKEREEKEKDKKKEKDTIKSITEESVIPTQERKREKEQVGTDKTEERKLPCLFWKKGFCLKGTDCTYYHDQKYKDKQSEKICYEWEQKGSCSKDGCIWPHPNKLAKKHEPEKPSLCNEFQQKEACHLGNYCPFYHIPDPHCSSQNCKKEDKMRIIDKKIYCHSCAWKILRRQDALTKQTCHQPKCKKENGLTKLKKEDNKLVCPNCDYNQPIQKHFDNLYEYRFKWNNDWLDTCDICQDTMYVDEKAGKVICSNIECGLELDSKFYLTFRRWPQN